ncbi:nucleotidyltransferase family protein [Bacillus salacetis]|uniref:Nucleotidyltransferase family protein n=1 Tax=Bacillus salacetis TaxID=2315464 RepID=A0A3A1QZH4_9BACI|nr:nucleotidyltransferase family protein [Bacillus salacetis]RIW34699.1 nucleotidyltransferase family protein [Bacillus salacetis]
MKTKEDVLKTISEDEQMMRILKAAKSVQLPDWWICAGFVRSKIWDSLHGYFHRTEIPDVDVVYYDTSNIDEAYEKGIEEKLREVLPGIPWSVKNEARMHIINNIPPYTSTEDAISKFPETATGLGIKLDEQEKLILSAPHGLDDVLNMEIRPSPHTKASKELTMIYEERILTKDWPAIWPRVKVFH